MVYNREYSRRTYKWVKSKGDVAGSNKKPFQQKKTGRTPQGDKRAPNLYHGGRAHGARPRSFYFPLNKKIRLLGLKCMLTVKLIENKILLIDSDKIETENLSKLMESFRFLKSNRTLFVTVEQLEKEFENKIKKMPYIEAITPEVRIDYIK
jgi:large subunit ribosomal protein L4